VFTRSLFSPCSVLKEKLFASWKLVNRSSSLHYLLYFSSWNAILSLKIAPTVSYDIDKDGNHIPAQVYVLFVVYNTEVPILIR
jgi:hypothetical protein